MSQKQYDLVFFIGRFQPPTRAHIRTMANAVQYGNKVVILIGSVDIARDIDNPFTFDERRKMITMALEDQFGSDVVNNTFDIRGVIDHPYNDQIWAMQVQNIVYNLTSNIVNPKIALIGHKKDASSFYLDMFPQWDFIEQENFEGINATDVRKTLFEDVAERGFTGEMKRELARILPVSSVDFLNDFTKKWTDQDVYGALVQEYKHIKEYKEAWKAAPYPPTFVTVDACVVQSGHVLLIVRDASPGAGLFAIPGGFLDQHETLEDGMIRELREETKLKVPEPVLRGSIVTTRTYDYPKRSKRGRTITHAFLIQLRNGPLPAVKGSDDARKAFWMPIADIYKNKDKFFEDHYYILDDLLKRC